MVYSKYTPPFSSAWRKVLYGRVREFKMFQTADANGTIIPTESKTEPFSSVDGVIKVPTGSGLGINIDPEYIKTHKLI